MWRKDEKAVSPVIGVILMVAITVILAAVIASFVFGMGSNVKKTYVVSATASQQGSNIVVTYQGGPDHQSVDSLTIGGNVTSCSGGGISGTTDSTPAVGDTYTCDGGGSGQDHVIVTATFVDGTQQVILDTYV